MKVAAVIVNWNGGDDNLTCLDSLLAQSLAQEQCVFVDNASQDGSLERVRARFPGVRVLAQSKNLGYGGGNNLGIALALERGAQAVLIVNNDVTLAPGALAALALALEQNPKVGIVGPRVLYRDQPELVWAAGGMLSWRENLTTLRGHRRRDGAPWNHKHIVDYVLGCALLVRREVFEQAGLFDDRYFAYTEDVDFGLRARQAGWQSMVVGEVAALHAPSSATGGGYNPRRKYMMAVNSVWFLRRYGGLRQWLRFLLFDVASLPGAWLVGLFQGRSRAVLAKGLGIWHGLWRRRIRAEMLEPGSSWFW